MAEPSEPPVNWRRLVEAVPGGVGVQRGETLEYVSPTFAGVVGRDRAELVGNSWRTLFESREVDRIAEGLEVARTDGRWTGATWMVGAGRVPVELTLSTEAGDETVVWSVDDRHAEAVGRNAEETVELPPGTTSRLARTVLSTVDDVVYIIDDDGSLCFWNEQLAVTTGYSYEQIAEMHAKEFIPPDQHEYVPGLMEAIESIDDRRVEVDILTSDGERIPHEFSGTTFEDPVSGRSFRCGVARDISERLERERNLERQRDELEALNRINELLFETAKESIRTGQGDVALQVLCERIAASEFYRFAWLGRAQRGANRVRHSTSSGIDDGPTRLETVDGDDPVSRAIDTGTVVVTACGEETTPRWHGWAAGVESLTVVPLHHRETVYGVLVLGSGQQDAFTRRERTGLEVLGRLVGVVLHAERTRRLLFADGVVELGFDATGVETPFTALAAELDATVSLDGYVPSGDGWVVYLSVDGASPADVDGRLTGEPRVERVRPITDGRRGGRLEVVVSGSPLLERVTAAGAAVKTATAEPDCARLTVEAPVDADVQAVADRIVEAYPAASLLASRERDQGVTTSGQPGSVLDGLTSRQREVLEVAYRSGYFDWPRESTGEEVAEALELTAATVQGHLRKAEREVFTALLGSE